MDYQEQLRDPRWQKKRLEVLERAGFACEECSNATKELQVHHRYYNRGAMAWEYGFEVLRCLCVDCHKRRTELDKFLKIALGNIGFVQAEVVLRAVRKLARPRPLYRLEDLEAIRTQLKEADETKDHDKAVELIEQYVSLSR